MAKPQAAVIPVERIEVRAVCDQAHRLLGAEVAGGNGAAETERVCLDIPKGLLLIAQCVVAREHFSRVRRDRPVN